MKSWFQDHDIEMYAKYNNRKSFIPKRFVRTLKNKVRNT